MNRNLMLLAGVSVLMVVGALLVVLNQAQEKISPTKPASGTRTSNAQSKPESPTMSPIQGRVTSPIKKDEEVVFYPTVGWFVGIPHEPENQYGFEIEIHGCIFEAGKHAVGVKLIRELTGIDDTKLTIEEARLFQQRAELFAVDHERGKAIPIRIGDSTYLLPESEANGHFQGRIRLGEKAIATLSEDRFRELQVVAVTRDGDDRTLAGQVHVAPMTPPVVRVISDIDDTIKISQVRNKPELLLNTFCRPFRPVLGMSDLYRTWAEQEARFHYVSGSPWQLYSPLAEFIREHKFPAGSFHMKLFRPTDRTAKSLFGSQVEYKRGVITSLFDKFPRDRFILVGDSGEQDAKIYSDLARENPRLVSHILIHNVTDEPLDVFRETFAGLPDDQWQVFHEPSEIKFRLSEN